MQLNVYSQEQKHQETQERAKKHSSKKKPTETQHVCPAEVSTKNIVDFLSSLDEPCTAAVPKEMGDKMLFRLYNLSRGCLYSGNWFCKVLSGLSCRSALLALVTRLFAFLVRGPFLHTSCVFAIVGAKSLARMAKETAKCLPRSMRKRLFPPWGHRRIRRSGHSFLAQVPECSE